MERHEVIVLLQEAVDFYSLPEAERQYDDSEECVTEWIETLRSAIDLLVLDAHVEEVKKPQGPFREDDRGKNVYTFYNEEDDAHVHVS